MQTTSPVIAAVRTDEEFEAAILSPADTIFFLYPDIMELTYIARKAHGRNKQIFIHIDLTTGLGKDQSGLEFAKNAGIDGIISTRASMIKLAKKCGLQTVQRFFIVDSRSIDTTVETIRDSKADMVEIMPGIAYKSIQRIQKSVNIPIIAGGLVEFREEIYQALNAGASMVSTGKAELWNE